jgi:hypothetical protein
MDLKIALAMQGLHVQSMSSTQISSFFIGVQTVMDPCCSYCGAVDALAENDEIDALHEQFGIVRPICNACFSSGKKPLTRSVNRGAKRARRHDDDDN